MSFSAEQFIGQQRLRLGQLSRARLRLRQDEVQIERAKSQLPDALDKNKEQLERTRDYMRQVREDAERIKGQRKDVARQVMGQKAKYREAAINLARQGREQRSKIDFYRQKAIRNRQTNLELNEFIFEDLRKRWWLHAIWGLKLLRESRTEIRPMDTADLLHAASRAWRLALDGRPSVNRKKFIKAPSVSRCPAVTEAEMFPKLAKLSDGYEKQFAQLDKAEQDLAKQVGKREQQIREAYASLAERERDAYRRLQEALAKRGKQMRDLRTDEMRILKHEDKLKDRAGQIARAEDQARSRKAGLARGAASTRRAIVRGKQAIAARRKRLLRSVRDFTTGKTKRAPSLGRDAAWLRDNHPLLYEDYRRKKNGIK